MPDGNDWAVFREFVRAAFGFWDALRLSRETYQETQTYKDWVALGKPSAEDYLAYLEERRWGELEPYEVKEEVGEGPYFVEDYPDPPYELGEGFEWVKITNDPTTGAPVEPQWVSQAIEEEEELDIASGKIIVPGRLIEMPDGTYRDPNTGLLIDADVAARIIEEYKPEEEGLTPWEEAQKARWEEELALEREQLEAQKAQWGAETAATARERELADRLRLQQELAELGGPADWIKRWQMIHGVVPRAEATRMSERAWTLLTEAQDLTGAERLAKEQQAAGLEWGAQKLLTQTRGLPEAPGFYYSPMKEWTPAEMKQAQAYEQMLQDGGGVTTPPAPEWLPQFVESQVAGQPITKDRTTTPSGQQWTATPLSHREGLRGYTEFAGYRPYSDILSEMAQMQTRTPVGAGRTQWKPATQRA